MADVDLAPDDITPTFNDHWGTHGDDPIWNIDDWEGEPDPTPEPERTPEPVADIPIAAPEAITHASTLDYDTSGYVPMTDALAAAIHAYETPQSGAVKVI